METRQWLGSCDQEAIGVQIKGEDGQFDGIPYDPYEIKCPFMDCDLFHLLLPVTAERYAEWADDPDQEDNPQTGPDGDTGERQE